MIFTSHARRRVRQRHLDLTRISAAIDRVEGLLTEKAVEISVGDYHIVAAKQNGIPTVITAWKT